MHPILINIAVAIAYFLAVAISFSLEPMPVSHVWLGSGVSLAITFLYGTIVLPGVAAGSIISSLFHGANANFAFLFAAKICFESFIGRFLLKKCHFSLRFGHIQEVWSFVGIAQVIAAVSNLFTLLMFPQFANYFQYWQGDFFGILIVCPLVFSWSQYNFKQISLNKCLEEIFWTTGLMATSWFVFCSRTRTAYFEYPLAHIPPSFLTWAGLKFGQRGVSIGNCVIAYFVFGGLARNTGPFIKNSQPSIISAQLFILVSSVVALLIAAYITQTITLNIENQLKTSAQETKNSADDISSFKSQFFASAAVTFRESFTLASQFTKALIKSSYKYPEIQSEAYELGHITEVMLGFTDQLEDMAKVESGNITLYMQTISTKEITEKIVEIVTPLIGKHSNKLECHVIDTDIYTDRGKLLQILLSLLRNATNTASNGTITLSIENLAGQYIVFLVSNRRGGVAIEELRQIIQPFSLTGLEITMSQKLASMLGGSLVIDILEFGISFRLTLPLRKQ